MVALWRFALLAVATGKLTLKVGSRNLSVGEKGADSERKAVSESAKPGEPLLDEWNVEYQMGPYHFRGLEKVRKENELSGTEGYATAINAESPARPPNYRNAADDCKGRGASMTWQGLKKMAKIKGWSKPVQLRRNALQDCGTVNPNGQEPGPGSQIMPDPFLYARTQAALDKAELHLTKQWNWVPPKLTAPYDNSMSWGSLADYDERYAKKVDWSRLH